MPFSYANKNSRILANFNTDIPTGLGHTRVKPQGAAVP